MDLVPKTDEVVATADDYYYSYYVWQGDDDFS